MRRGARSMVVMGLGILLAACSSGTENPIQPAPPAAVPQAAAPAAPAPQPSQSPAAIALAAARSKTREEQRDLIASLIGDGVFAQIELHEGVPRVYLRPAYRLLTDRDKHLYLATVYAFAFPDGPGPGLANKVVLIDDVTGQQAGVFTEDGFQTKR